MSSVFPTVTWSDRTVTFVPSDEHVTSGENSMAALVFAFDANRVALANIRGRGWCIPGGRLEPGETPQAATAREAYEEAGITLGELVELGRTVDVSCSESPRTLAISYVSTIESCGSIPDESESAGVQFSTIAELPALYYMWDPLIDAMFQYAWTRIPHI